MTQVRLIYTDLKCNNNKYWHASVDGTVLKCEWGRIGDAPQRKNFECGSTYSAEHMLERKQAEKLRKGYTVQQTLAEGQSETVSNIGYIAKVQIEHSNDRETESLIEFLVQRNIHAIEGMTNIRMQAGQLSTPLGPVTQAGIAEAQLLLLQMSKPKIDLDDLANRYLRIVPRSIGHHRIEARDLFGTRAQLEREQDMLDSLKAVVADTQQRGPTVFQTKLQLIDLTASDFKRIDKFFLGNINRNHSSSNMRLCKVWQMSVQIMDDCFESKLGNVKELWHGTRDANLLSILKNGYIIPKRNQGIAIAGRMYGDGIYFSDQSTKSLNYATGFWGQGGSSRCFMLLNNVAMGKEYMTKHGFTGTVAAGFDSCFAQAGTSGVRNNEMIVYRTSQVKPTYLCEFA